MSKTCKKAVYVLLTGGILVQVGSCVAAVGPLAASLGESIFLTWIFGRGF
jgi:hypothetical protein